VPYSIGERVREWDSKQVILEDEPSLISWGFNFNIDYRGNLWKSDQVQNLITYISKEYESMNAIFKVAGKTASELRVGESTYRNGNLAKATFKKPSSVAIYDRNETRIVEQASLTPFYLISNSTHLWHKRIDCIYGNARNFTYFDKDLLLKFKGFNPCGMIIN